MVEMSDIGAPNFSRPHVVSFGQVDAAGLVFYPRYLEMVSDTVEAWFDEGLGRPFARLHLVERVGVPTVAISCTFPKPSRLGDRLTMTLHLLEVGRSKFRVRVRALCGAETRMEAEATLVFTDLDRMKARTVPDDLRAAMRGATR